MHESNKQTQQPGMEAAHVLPQLLLIIGGARSGKSTFAERLALESKRTVAYIATATADDQEMQARIARHQAVRPAAWQTIEEPLYLTTAIQKAADSADVVLLDCMTLWLSNWLLRHAIPDDDTLIANSAQYDEQIRTEIEALLSTIAALESNKRLIVVSNEVGLGVVPPYALGRVYQDVLGRVNQQLAARAARVYLMLAGLPVDIKQLQQGVSL